eukprot:m51a1_g7255 hypothetical protein (307) ;mRNA; r:155584-156730
MRTQSTRDVRRSKAAKVVKHKAQQSEAAVHALLKPEADLAEKASRSLKEISERIRRLADDMEQLIQAEIKSIAEKHDADIKKLIDKYERKMAQRDAEIKRLTEKCERKMAHRDTELQSLIKRHERKVGTLTSQLRSANERAEIAQKLVEELEDDQKQLKEQLDQATAAGNESQIGALGVELEEKTADLHTATATIHLFALFFKAKDKIALAIAEHSHLKPQQARNINALDPTHKAFVDDHLARFGLSRLDLLVISDSKDKSERDDECHLPSEDKVIAALENVSSSDRPTWDRIFAFVFGHKPGVCS